MPRKDDAVWMTAEPPPMGVTGSCHQSAPLLVASKNTVPDTPEGGALGEAEGEVLGLWLAELEALGEADADGLTDALGLIDADALGETDRETLPDGEALPEGDADPDGLGLPLGLVETEPDGLTLGLALTETDDDGLTDAELSTA